MEFIKKKSLKLNKVGGAGLTDATSIHMCNIHSYIISINLVLYVFFIFNSSKYVIVHYNSNHMFYVFLFGFFLN